MRSNIGPGDQYNEGTENLLRSLGWSQGHVNVFYTVVNLTFCPFLATQVRNRLLS